jgi:beta-lactamase superfamily II metal-dependent hydrolase
VAGGDLEIVAWDVQHGVSLFASTPNDRTIILDAGASDAFSPVDWLKGRFQLQRLDGLIISHAHADHVREVGKIHSELKPRVLLRNKAIPGNVLYPNGPPTMDPLKSYDALDRAYNSPADPGDLFDNPANWGGVQIRTFHNSAPQQQFTNVNDYSVVTILDFGGLKFLFPGDLEAPGWQALMARDDFRKACVSTVPQVRVLLAPHHGHTAGVYMPFLDLYKPAVTIISAVHGDQHTDADVYRNASSGWNVYDSGAREVRECKVLTTKTNDYVLVRLDAESNNVFIGV